MCRRLAILTCLSLIHLASLDPAPKQVEKILDVQQGEISYLVGTIYMEMKLKPNILDDITKDVCKGRQPFELYALPSRVGPRTDHFVPASPSNCSTGLQPNPTGQSTQTIQTRFTWRTSLVVSSWQVSRSRTTFSLLVYSSPPGDLTTRNGIACWLNGKLTTTNLPVGVVMGVLGSEDPNGDFKVVDICYAGQGSQDQHTLMETGTTAVVFLARLLLSVRNFRMILD